MKYLDFVLGGLFFCLFMISCNKDEELTFDPNAKLSLSADSILFDTVFTSIGSTSRRLKIKNLNPKAIPITQIKLAGGNSSAFSLNINGNASSTLNNFKLNGKDSINIFVKVNINPTLSSLPFIVQDSILIDYNGKKQSIPLIAYGQNAIFINNATLSGNVTWDNKLPYIIYKSVTIAENATLTIPAGARILFHGNASMHIKGILQANGNKADSIVFASDRLEQAYANESGQWNGLHFYPESKNAKINYAIIKNAVVGITADSLANNTQPKLLLTNSIVKNMEVVGFLGYQTHLAAFNNLFYNCGQYLFYAAGGGQYNLKQNTFAGYNTYSFRKTPAIYISDYISSTIKGNINLLMYNNIVWGKLNDELLIDQKDKNTQVTATLQHNLLKSTQLSFQNNGNLLNVDPQFINSELGNFKLTNNSPAKGKGINLSNDDFINFLSKDLNGKTRIFPSSLGCYENN